MKHSFNEFSKIMHGMGRKFELSKVFNDLLTMSICSFHRTNLQSQLRDKDEDNEALYMNTIKPYARENLNEFAKAIGILQLNAAQNPYSDILGEFFMQDITKGQNGQYFTPEPICDMMAQMQLSGDDGEFNKRVHDPACGSGRLLLSGAKLNPKNYFFGADNSNTCAKMATLNFFMNGLRGEVAWMNSLSMKFYGGWHINTNGIGIAPIEAEQSQIWSTPPVRKDIDLKSKEPDEIKFSGDQLTFF
ncbi:N-6 DNA methylase [Kordia sp.]|uniref:N-6 DNA methylase n=1 Tax=Kordia sp. TaxID=1965332 RepID=UPI003D6A03D8